VSRQDKSQAPILIIGFHKDDIETSELLSLKFTMLFQKYLKTTSESTPGLRGVRPAKLNTRSAISDTDRPPADRRTAIPYLP
jgi:hypothetical protein